MKKVFLTAFACLLTLASWGQEEDIDNRLANIDWREDSMEITTISDIVKTQQTITNRAAQESHLKKVWAHRGYFNISYHTQATMSPSSPLETGVPFNGGYAPEYKASIGASIQVGRSIKLHKPIANMLLFNLDYTGIDLNFNRYKAENKGMDIYDASKKYSYTDDDGDLQGPFYHNHWNVEKYEVSYGMSLGPSVTLAPFTHIDGAKGLHFLKFNFFYHIGYCASLLFLNGDVKNDVSYDEDDKAGKKALKERFDGQFMIGHGLYQSWGVSMTWKRIGLGYEHRWGKMKYKNVKGKSEYDDLWTKFDTTTNRLFLSIKIGK